MSHEAPACSVRQLVDAYLAWARDWYIDPPGEVVQIRAAVDRFAAAFPDTPTRDIRPRHLKQHQRALAEKFCRRYVNQQVGRIKRMFKWGVTEDLVPGAAWQALGAVEGIPRGRSRARESERVLPVSWPVVEATLEHLREPHHPLVLLMWWTGARMGELRTMRTRDVDRQGDVWIYRPERHKAEHHGRRREILLGGHAIEIIRPRLQLDRDAYLFPGAKSHKRRQGMAEDVPVSMRAVQGAIERAAKKAGVEHWTPHQLRHAAATRITKEYGIEAAQIILGHANLTVTEIYAERDMDKAKDIVRRIG